MVLNVDYIFNFSVLASHKGTWLFTFLLGLFFSAFCIDSNDENDEEILKQRQQQQARPSFLDESFTEDEEENEIPVNLSQYMYKRGNGTTCQRWICVQIAAIYRESQGRVKTKKYLLQYKSWAPCGEGKSRRAISLHFLLQNYVCFAVPRWYNEWVSARARSGPN